MEISIATSIKYGNYKAELPTCKRYIETIKRNWALVCDIIGISVDSEVIIHFRPIRGRTRGEYASHLKQINIDPRSPSSTQAMLETLCHELQHYKQYTSGELEQVYDKKIGSWMHIWQGTTYKRHTTEEQYWNSPWEVEARCAGALGREVYTRKLSKAWAKREKVC